MMEDGSLPRLSANRLMAVDRALDELARTQRRSSIPVELPMPNFWDAVGQLVQHLEAELAETIRSEGMTAKAQLQSRKLGVVRTAVKDLTRNRLNAFTQHAVLTNLIQSPEDVRASAGVRPDAIEWDKHDPSERVFYTGIGHLVDKYRHEVSWKALLSNNWDSPAPPPMSSVHTPLTEFIPDSDGGEVAEESNVTVIIDSEPNWEDPEYDEEDRIREIDEFPEIAPLGRGFVDETVSQQQKDPDMRRILILQDLDDPIITEDGEEITLTTGDIEFCPSIIADTLIAAGIAEAADL
ncbi:MAG TPA: hypothetical protein D7H74_05810 [Candidatus Poseidoniales archaeon]|nr:MAG TPA: hypothetical protein D7H74_05810 [Candidatus Poseidoniales archaeon]